MSVAAFIDRSLGIDDPDSLFQSYLEAIAEYGVDRVMYSPVRNTCYNGTIIPGISHCYPEDWVSYYMERGYVDLDPVLQHGVASRHAFTWDEIPKHLDLTAEQTQFMGESESAGLLNGLAVPLHGPMGEVYGLGLASSVANPDVDRHLKEIQILSTHFHVLYSGMHDDQRIMDNVTLTPRELEVLKWCAAGKSNWSIGEILGISEHGVDFHVRNILRKLEADTRITAVVKALQSGMIAL
ncbi:autoinducer binding domain-containing protein [Pseudomonadota bacterium]